jgi:hypothetical protein
VTLPIAFAAVRQFEHQRPTALMTLEAVTRKLAGRTFRKEHLVAVLIDKIKGLLIDDGSGDA